MKIRKVAVGNAAEAFIEGNFTNGVNIISSDDNNKGKTIVIQSMMYALGNEPTFPTSFEFQKYYYYIEFEEAGIIFKLCRSGDGFVLKRESTVLIFDNVSELKRYWNRNIFPLPSIAKNQLLRIVDSGSEATIFHVVKLFALQFVLRHSFPIVIDSFRAEDLSTGKENTVLEISKSIDKQVILTTTLKHEEIGKYDDLPDVNHINYQSHTPSKILDGAFVESFVALLNDLSIEI